MFWVINTSEWATQQQDFFIIIIVIWVPRRLDNTDAAHWAPSCEDNMSRKDWKGLRNSDVSLWQHWLRFTDVDFEVSFCRRHTAWMHWATLRLDDVLLPKDKTCVDLTPIWRKTTKSELDNLSVSEQIWIEGLWFFTLKENRFEYYGHPDDSVLVTTGTRVFSCSDFGFHILRDSDVRTARW